MIFSSVINILGVYSPDAFLKQHLHLYAEEFVLDTHNPKSLPLGSHACHKVLMRKRDPLPSHRKSNYPTGSVIMSHADPPTCNMWGDLRLPWKQGCSREDVSRLGEGEIRGRSWVSLSRQRYLCTRKQILYSVAGSPPQGQTRTPFPRGSRSC